MTKKVAFGKNPRERRPTVTPDDWVALGSNVPDFDEPVARPERLPTTRFTIDIPTDLHARIKAFCALKRVKMRDEILVLLEEHFKDSLR
jgi:hypothetical protein